MPELADVFRAYGPAYVNKYGDRMLPSHKRAMQDIVHCRTGQLGGTTYYCPKCADFHYSYHSCKNRHCPKCQNGAADDWIAMQQEKLLPVQYFMITVTLPSEFRRTARSRQKTVYRLFFQTSAEAMQLLAKDPRFLGGEIGLLGVLQTWTRAMEYHPHIHFLIPGGALSTDHKRWLSAKPDFLLPAKPLAIIFKAKFRDALKKAGLYESVPKGVWKKDWVIDIEPVGNGEAAIKYLAPYIFRVAISNRNIVSMKDGQITFRYKDSKTQETIFRTLAAERFISLFLQHVLPAGFIKVRYFGFYASSKKHLLAIVKELLEVRPLNKELSIKLAKVFNCPDCGKPMIAVEDIPAKRGPPLFLLFKSFKTAI
jgi:predicted RNA-binding Zn-ribbon protein involved in translation (DUF1610 family)